MNIGKIYFLALVFLASNLGADCGEKRRAVKTLTDAGAAKVADLQHPKEVSIREMTGWHRGKPIKKSMLKLANAARLNKQEKTIYLTRGHLSNVKYEADDQGYHLILSDGQGRTIIAETVSTDCAAGSPFLEQIQKVQAAVEERFGAKEKFRRHDIDLAVVVTGPAFFDFAHGQRGHADNYVEIHPILDIRFE
ncbi:MAG: hypothetical protein V4498_10535 [candidate division FCPU426 bacterium]